MANIEKAKQIIEESGNSLHYKVVDFLREDNWQVSVSPYYTDNYSEKPREIDIIAEKNFPITAPFGGFNGTINVQLFIECKYIKEDTVFWFDKRNRTEALDLVLRTTPLEDPRRWSMTERHHYLNDAPVAKLFASKGQTADGEVFYKAMTQALNGMIAYEASGSFLPDEFNRIRNDQIKCILKYPVIITNSFECLYKYDVVEKTDPEIIEKEFQFETQYAYYDYAGKQKNQFFLIDVVNSNGIGEYLKMLESSDLGAIKQKLLFNIPN